MPDSEVDVTLVTVSTNEAPLIERCFAAVQRHKADLVVEHVLVDNVCTDDSVERALAQNPDAVVVRAPRKLGFSPNSNLGLRVARGRTLGLLNPDTEVRAGALQTLVRTLDEHPDVGIVGPKLLNPDGSVQLSVRRFPNLSSTLVRRTPLRAIARGGAADQRHLNVDFDHDRTQDCDWMLGAALIARRNAVDEVGILDEGLPMYVDDIDWCIRMHKAGWGVRYVADAEIVHDHQAVSDKKFLSRNFRLHLQSMAHFTRTHGLRQVIFGGRPPAGTPSRGSVPR
jgi:N-acetylglucosaminyl-diphospho-decaprenol L-rhamnosyltransferase